MSAIVARPEAIELRDANGGLVETLDYRSDATEAVALFTTVFGGAPIDEEYPGSSHDAPSTAHRWGSFELWELRYVNQWEGLGTPRTLYMPSFRVRFTAADSTGISLSTREGIQAGSSWSELSANPGLRTNPSGCSGPCIDFVEYPETWTDGTEHVRKFATDFEPTDDGASIAQVRAPVVVQEEGCA